MKGYSIPDNLPTGFHLVIGDPHVAPGQNLERFDWLGQLIVDERPETIICIGDIGSFDSVSSYAEKGSKIDIENPTLSEDCASVREAMTRLFAPLRALQAKQKEGHRERYRPRKVLTLGNHEQRKSRWDNANPKFADAISLPDLCGFNDPAVMGEYAWETYPYGEMVEIDGIDYVHAPFNKMGRPFAGVNVARTVGLAASRHIVFGHTHNCQLTNLPTIGNGLAVRSSYNVGAFLPDGAVEGYARNTNAGWQHMIAKIWPSHDPKVGFDLETMQVWRLQQLYS